MRGFDDLVSKGMVLYTGVSNAPAWWIAQANTLAELRGWTRFVGLQVEYSLIERTVEREMVPMAKAMGLGVTAWSPLTGGWLSGKHGGGAKSGGRLDDEQLRGNFLEINDRAQAIVREVAAIGTELGRSSTQVALAWLRHREVPVIPIIGTRKLAQLKDNLASVEVKLGGDHLARLDRVSRIEMGYAHSFFEKDLVRAFSTGGMGQLTDRP